MHVIRYHFRNIQWTYLEKSSKVLILGPKMAPLPHFGQHKNFPEKRASALFSVYWTLTSCKNSEKNPEKTALLFDGQSWIHRALRQSWGSKNLQNTNGVISWQILTRSWRISIGGTRLQMFCKNIYWRIARKSKEIIRNEVLSGGLSPNFGSNIKRI